MGARWRFGGRNNLCSHRSPASKPAYLCGFWDVQRQLVGEVEVFSTLYIYFYTPHSVAPPLQIFSKISERFILLPLLPPNPQKRLGYADYRGGSSRVYLHLASTGCHRLPPKISKYQCLPRAGCQIRMPLHTAAWLRGSKCSRYNTGCREFALSFPQMMFRENPLTFL